MVTCPRCQQPVDETVRASCPLCFTPIPQGAQGQASPAGLGYDMPVVAASESRIQAGLTGQPPQQPYSQAPETPYSSAPSPLMAAGERRSLSGDVISPVPGSGYAGAAADPGRGGPVAPGEQGAPAAPRSTSSRLLVLAIAVVLVLGCAGGGWYLWMHRTNPKDQALAALKAYLTRDFTSAYALTALGPEDAKRYPDPASFAAAQQSVMDRVLAGTPVLAPVKRAVADGLKAAAATAAVGEPSGSGDKAEVPTSSRFSILAFTVKMNGMAHMVNDNGIWKVDMRGGLRDPKPIQDLLGKAQIGSGGG